MTMKNVFGCAVCTVLLACFAGCDDSSDGDGSVSYDSLLSGDFLAAMFSESDYGLGDMTYSGSGSGTYSYDIGMSDSGTFTYSVAKTNWVTGSGGGSDAQGIASDDGSLVVYVDNSYIEFHVTASTNADTSTLTGTFNTALFTGSGYGIGTATYDGSGNASYTYTKGDISDSDTFTYSVATDGRINGNDGTDDFYGIMSADGTLVVYAGSDYIEVQIKQAVSGSASDLSGTYNTAMGSSSYGMGTAYYDGTLDGSYTYTKGISGSGTFTYLVAADGNITGNDGTDDFYGIMSSDGTLAVYAGSDYMEVHCKK